MTCAEEHAEVGTPGTDGGVVLMSHNARDLMQMSEVVSGPGGEELGHGDNTKGRVASVTAEIGRLEIQIVQLLEILTAEASELVEELRKGLAFAFAELGPAIECLKGSSFAGFENAFHARHPVGAFAVDEVADDVVGTPGVFAFVGVSPEVGQIAEESAECGGSAGEKRDCARQIMFHGYPLAEIVPRGA